MNLSELIQAHKGRRSYPELERDCGGKPSSKRLQQLASAPIANFPDPPTIQALARGLRVPQRVVVLSAAESLGLHVDDAAPRLMQLMPAMASTLSEEQAAAVAHLVDVIVRDPLRIRGSIEEESDTDVDPRLADEPTVASVRRAQLRAVDDEAARDMGREGTARKQRNKQDQAGEPPADDQDDMEPR